MKLEYLERAIKSNFILTCRVDRSLTGAKPGEEMWPLYDCSWKEIADYLGYFVEEVKEFYDNSRSMRTKSILAKIKNKKSNALIEEYTTKYNLVRSSVSFLTKPIINEFNIYQR
jgi:hypothetical protein